MRKLLESQGITRQKISPTVLPKLVTSRFLSFVELEETDAPLLGVWRRRQQSIQIKIVHYQPPLVMTGRPGLQA
jgi:hypothetical protein